MNVLLFHPQVDVMNMVGFCLESQNGITTFKAEKFHEVVDLFLSDNHIDVVVTSVQPDIEKLLKYVSSSNIKVQFIFVGQSPDSALKAFPDLKNLGTLIESQIPDKLIELVGSNFGKVLSTADDGDYCRIHTSLLLRVAPLRADIFIRLSSVKYVKLFNNGATFTQQDFEKFLVQRKVTHLYIRKSDSSEFIGKFKEDILNLLEHANSGDQDLLNTAAEVQDTIMDLNNKLGFTKEVQEIARNNVKLALKSIGKSEKLTKALQNSVMIKKNYISSHSVVLANLSCSIAAKMEWPSNTTFEKLVTASLFHDIIINDESLAQINTKSQLESMKSQLTEGQYDLVKHHMINAGVLLKSMNEIPSDVDVIVMQHHERPDGSGFPKGMTAHQIAPLAAVLIVAHDILDEMHLNPGNFTIESFMKKNEKNYSSGGFKKVWRALKDEESDSTESSAA